MSDEMTGKIIAALRDMAAKVDETVSREEPDFDDTMWFAMQQNRLHPPATRTVTDHRYDRAWLSGRLLGLADGIEALTGKGTA